ncbi:MAG: aldo/keto reductase [Oscillospiraceae bacterium]|nr:aldo/keto reductase [Oscillospiraceae bacterium]
MDLRNFGKTPAKLSPLGFGAMRLPCINGNPSNINIPLATKMVRYAIDNGVNYVDTAYVYHSEKSEEFLGDALSDGYREKIYLATKSPIWKIDKFEDYEKILDTELKRLKTDHIDMYLTHSLNKDTWEKMKKLNIFKFLETAKKEGKIRNIGFSFHDDLKTFKEIVDGYSWDFCQMQYNYMDVDYQQGEEGLNYAYDKGFGIVIMEPLKGGKLSRKAPDDINETWGKLLEENSYAELALRWVWNNPKVSVVLSGMSTMEQVIENVKLMHKYSANNLTEEEKAVYEKVKEKFLTYTKVDCTACRYCMPCPNGVDIPGCFEFYNDSVMFNNKDQSKPMYKGWFRDSGAHKCVECGACEALCPQKIQIIDKLKEVREYFDN